MYAQPQFNVVYTSGTFDLFHSNHLSLLKRAKQLCKMLIVGVNTDELVCSYKNPLLFPSRSGLQLWMPCLALTWPYHKKL